MRPRAAPTFRARAMGLAGHNPGSGTFAPRFSPVAISWHDHIFRKEEEPHFSAWTLSLYGGSITELAVTDGCRGCAVIRQRYAL
jgi:hypothetical protein